MGIFDWLRKPKNGNGISQEDAEGLRLALKSCGIDEDSQVIAWYMNTAKDKIKLKFATSNELTKSELADLERVGPEEFNLNLLCTLVSRDGKVSGDATNIFALGVIYVAAALIAEKNGRSDYSLGVGERIGLGQLVGAEHPLNSLLAT